jgi:hypothetical protein
LKEKGELPMKPGIEITVTDNRTGEIVPRASVKETTDYVPPTRLVVPPAPKPAELTLDEVRELLAVATLKLTDMDSEIKLITERAAEVRTKLSDSEKALVAALSQNKLILADYARGKADDKAVTQGQENVRNLENLIAGLKDVTGVIASELAALQEPRKYQKERLINGYHDMAWRLVAGLEREAAKPFLCRAYCAEMQRRVFSYTAQGGEYPEAVKEAAISDLLKSYNLPPR